MELEFFYKKVSEKEKKRFLEYVEKKIDSIESLLGSFDRDEVLLKINIEKF